ncbi:MAG TPA: glycosyltransferase family 87 protein [Candidatus Omnitrophota bacterium]|nr:glycosyltransferase family 87 protein [Candidatus Omnitrophota bacterium]
MLSYFSLSKAKLITCIALLIGLTILGYSTVYRAAWGEKSRTDLTVYLRAAEAIPDGENIYAVENQRHWHYVYLPLLAILLIPFTSLPLWLNALLWYALSIATLFGTFWGLKTLFRDQERGWAVISACFLVALPPLLNTLTRGQLGALSLFLTLLPFILDQSGKKFTAGFILGFAIVLKMSPLLILPFYFLLNRNWRALAGCAAGGFLFGLLIPTLIFGPELHYVFLRNYYDAISGGTGNLAHQSYLWGELFTPFAGDNQSFYAVLTRFYWKTEALFIGHSNGLIRKVNFIFLLTLLAAVTLHFFKSKKEIRKALGPWQPKIKNEFTVYSLLSCIMLFTSPVSQLHHFTPLVLLSASAFLQSELHPSSRKMLWGAMALCLIFFTTGMIFDSLAVLGLPLWGSLALWFVVLISYGKNNPNPSPS